MDKFPDRSHDLSHYIKDLATRKILRAEAAAEKKRAAAAKEAALKAKRERAAEKGAQERVEEDRVAAERKAQRKVEEERAAAEREAHRRAEEEQAAAEREAQRIAERERVAAETRARQRAEAEQAAAARESHRRAEEERAAAAARAAEVGARIERAERNQRATSLSQVEWDNERGKSLSPPPSLFWGAPSHLIPHDLTRSQISPPALPPLDNIPREQRRGVIARLVTLGICSWDQIARFAPQYLPPPSLPPTFQPSNLPTFQPSNLPTFQPCLLRKSRAPAEAG